MLPGKLAAALDDLGALDVFGRREVVHDKDDFVGFKDARALNLLKLLDGQHAR